MNDIEDMNDIENRLADWAQDSGHSDMFYSDMKDAIRALQKRKARIADLEKFRAWDEEEINDKAAAARLAEAQLERVIEEALKIIKRNSPASMPGFISTIGQIRKMERPWKK